LAGFVGYELTGISAIGFYRYMCATRPEDLYTYDQDGNLIDADGNLIDENGNII